MNNTQIQKKFEEFNNAHGLGSLDLSQYTLGRTRFQMENFVIKEHDCVERKFLQVIVELKALRDGVIIDWLEQQKIKIEINRLLATGDEIDAIEAAKKQYTLGTMQEGMAYREREIQVLVDLLKQFPKMYTYDEIEAGEKTYWEKRLTRQIAEDMVTAQTGINQGNLRSAIHAGTSVEKYFLAFQEHFLTQMKHPELSEGQNTVKNLQQ